MRRDRLAFAIALALGCRGSPPRELGPGARPTAQPVPAADARVPVVFRRIAVVGASVSAGFAGTPLVDAMRAAAPAATVVGGGNVAMFRDPIGDGAAQIDRALAERPDLVIAIDFLFWHAYNAADAEDRMARIERGLGDLDRAVTAGAAVIVGDVPRIVTASELLIPRSAIPPAAELAAVGDQIRTWARARPRVVVVPFAAWAEPLTAGAEVEIAPGERRPARDLMAFDGLHLGALGVWYVMSRIDRLVEDALGVAPDAWQFARPAP